jgi:hypothetical protein
MRLAASNEYPGRSANGESPETGKAIVVAKSPPFSGTATHKHRTFAPRAGKDAFLDAPKRVGTAR